jgi:trimethylamine--corrinoid protein Co-methyltransferase
MKLNKLEVLSKDEIEIIHSASIKLLEKVGIKIDAEDCQDLLKKHGADVDPNSNFVKFPESLIKEQLKKVPDSFKLYGRDGSFNFEVNTHSTQFGTIGTPVRIYDPLKKKGLRKVVLDDNIKQIRVVDSLDHIMASHIDVWPSDVKYLTVHTECIYVWVKNTRKPYGSGCYGRVASKDMINMMSIIVGGEEELIQRPRLIGFMNPTSPLHLPTLMTNGLEVFAKYKQPTIIAPEALAGTSAPVTMAGLLTQTNAEIIAGIVLAQLYNPGAPVFFGTVSHITDMRSGNSAIGSVETGLMTAGIAQLARYYNIPSRGLGGVTDSKCFDIQNGLERYQTLIFAAQAGINYITCAGTYEATLAEALELLLIDDEIAGMINRAFEGIQVNEDTIGLDVIEKVATETKPGATFLSEKHTRKHMKNELYMPKLANRNRRTSWRKKGSKDIIGTASEKVEEILKNFTEFEIPPDMDKELKAYMKMADERSYDYFRKAEGIGAESVTLPDGIEIREDK